MIAMVLGLIVAGVAIAMFLTTAATYKASESLGRMQEADRTAFEMIARDLRDAGGNPCDNTSTNYTLTNNITTPTAQWWTDWAGGMVGYNGTTEFANPGTTIFGTGVNQRVAGTDALELKAGENLGIEVSADIATAAGDTNIPVNTTAGVVANDLLLMCDYRGGTIFKATGVTGVVNGTIQHATTGSPANAAANLPKTQPVDATNPPIWSTNATVSKVRATRWWVGCNGRNGVACNQPGGRSLYQSTLVNPGLATPVVTNEIASGVSGMTITYLLVNGTAYLDASAITTPAQWNKVAAVKVTLNLASPDRSGADGQPITRAVQHVISLRNHLP
jgi:type IV pilus assembly protein PilW